MSDLTIIRPRRPSALARARQFVRSLTLGPFNLKDPQLAKLLNTWSGGGRTAAGITVNHENAFTFSAVFDAVNQLSSDVAKLPLNLHKRRPDGGSDLYTDSKLYRLLKYEPNPEMGSMVLRRTVLAHALTWGNGYAEIERDAFGRPAAFWVITPDRVKMERDSAGSLRYRVSNPSKADTLFDPHDVIHIPGPSFDGTCGYSVINLARQAIGLALAAEQFGASFFGNGSTFGGIFTTDLPLGPEEAKGLREALESIHQGPERAHKLGVLWGGLKYNRIGVAPNEAQMNELRARQVEEVARFFNMPVHKLKNLDRATNNNIEQQDLEYYKGPVLNWATLIEEELNRKCIPALEARQQFIKHNANAFLRGDIKSRYEALGIARDKGIINADEWRELEEMNPQPNGQGKVYLVQAAQIPVDLLPKLVESQIKKNDTPPPPPKGETDPPNDDRVKELERQLVTAEHAVTEALAQAHAERELRTTAEAQHAEALVDLHRSNEQRHLGVASELEAIRVSIAADLARERELRSAAETASVEAAIRAEQAGSVLTAEQQARTTAEAALASVTARLDVAERTMDVADARAVAAEAALVSEQQRASAAEQSTEQARSAWREMRAACVAAEAARNAAWELMTQAEERCLALTETAATETATAKAERQAAEAARDEARAEFARLESRADAAIGQAAAAEAVRDAATAREAEARLALEDARSERDAARATMAAEQAEAEHARTLAQTATESRARLEADARTVQDARIAAETALRDAKQAEDEATDGLIAAHRTLFEHTMRLMVERETERARRQQQTPDKLRAWLASWYESHAALMTQALLPIVQVHVAFTRGASSPADLVAELVTAHIAESKRQLSAVVDGDAGALAASLAQLLQRWESERPAAFANRLMEQEIAYVRRRAVA